MQAVTRQSAYYPMPAILRQTVVCAKFCMSGTGPITAQQAAFWIRRVFPGLHKTSALYSTANNLNEYSETTFNMVDVVRLKAILGWMSGRIAQFAQATWQPS